MLSLVSCEGDKACGLGSGEKGRACNCNNLLVIDVASELTQCHL